MNRKHHLEQTLLKNINDNNYDYVEFLLLDYNSKDNLEEFVKTNFKAFIKKGRLIYYKTCSPKFFNRSHSRNMAFRLANGEIICNVDADNFLGTNFCEYLKNTLKTKSFISTISKDKQFPLEKDVGGRMSFFKEDFIKIRGLDERIINYGFEDYDFTNRLEQTNLKRILLKDQKYLNVIRHDDIERISNESIYETVNKIIIHHKSFTASSIMLYYNNNKGVSFDIFQSINKSTSVQILLKKKRFSDEYKLKNIAPFSWIEKNGHYSIFYSTSSVSLKRTSINTWKKSSKFFIEILSPDKIIEFISIFSELHNKKIMKSNLSEKITIVNPISYGAGLVFKNFNYHNKIELK